MDKFRFLMAQILVYNSTIQKHEGNGVNFDINHLLL